jgi:hypothetical protein
VLRDTTLVLTIILSETIPNSHGEHASSRIHVTLLPAIDDSITSETEWDSSILTGAVCYIYLILLQRSV